MTADDKLIDISARLAEVHAEFRELAVDYWGINKDNGKRSEIVALVEDHYKTKNLMKDYLAKRAETCLGLQAIKELQREDAELKVAKVNGSMQIKAMLIGQALTLIGIIITAVIK